MLIRHLVFSAVLLTTCVGSAAAQSSQDAKKPPTGDLSALSNLSDPLNHGYALKISPLPFTGQVKPGNISCYTIRAYQFERNDPSTLSATIRRRIPSS